MTTKWYVKGDDGRLTLYDDENRAKNARRGSQSWGVLEMTTLPDAPSYSSGTSAPSTVVSVGDRHGESCSCRSCQMMYHGGW